MPHGRGLSVLVSLRLVYFAVFRMSGWLAMLAASGLTAQTAVPAALPAWRSTGTAPPAHPRRSDPGAAGDALAGLAACPAHGPGADALARRDLLGHGDLLGRGGQIGRRGVLAAAVAEPGLPGELQPAVEAVAGVG